MFWGPFELITNFLNERKKERNTTGSTPRLLLLLREIKMDSSEPRREAVPIRRDFEKFSSGRDILGVEMVVRGPGRVSRRFSFNAIYE